MGVHICWGMLSSILSYMLFCIWTSIPFASYRKGDAAKALVFRRFVRFRNATKPGSASEVVLPLAFFKKNLKNNGRMTQK